MGDQLVAFYKKANEIGGLSARVKLATMTAIPSQQAQSAPDSPENIRKFQEAIAKL